MFRLQKHQPANRQTVTRTIVTGSDALTRSVFAHLTAWQRARGDDDEIIIDARSFDALTARLQASPVANPVLVALITRARDRDR